MTLALVSPRRNRRSRAQTSIFTVEHQHFLVQMAPQASWPRDVPAESWKPGVLSQESPARIHQPVVFRKDSSDSSAENPRPAISSKSVWGPRRSHFDPFQNTQSQQGLLATYLIPGCDRRGQVGIREFVRSQRRRRLKIWEFGNVSRQTVHDKCFTAKCSW